MSTLQSNIRIFNKKGGEIKLLKYEKLQEKIEEIRELAKKDEYQYEPTLQEKNDIWGSWVGSQTVEEFLELSKEAGYTSADQMVYSYLLEIIGDHPDYIVNRDHPNSQIYYVAEAMINYIEKH